MIEDSKRRIDKKKEKFSQDKPAIDSHYIRPEKAERKLRMASGINQTIWCSGVSGCGKTSFVVDFLKRKRYHYYSAKNNIASDIIFPEASKASESVEKQNIVVIDDLYGIEPAMQGEWYDVISEFVKRQDIWLILLSRSDIPIWLHTMSIENIFYRIKEEDLLVTKKQMEEYLELWQLAVEEETKEKIWELGEGHPLWSRICAMELKAAGISDKTVDTGNLGGAITHHNHMKKVEKELAIIKEAQESIWKYLNIHVYDQWDIEIQEMLMKLSILGEFDLSMAVYMTGNSNVNILLERATDLGGFLTLKNGIWTIRLPMCQSMMQRLYRYYDVPDINSFLVRAGDCLKIKGKLMEALSMYEMANDERRIAQVLIQNARENPSTGHYYEMRHYYLRIPDEYIRKSIELMGGMSMLQSMLMNEEESERWYEELKTYANNRTGSIKREAMNRLLYLDIALPHRGSLQLLDLLKNASKLLLQRKIKLPEFSVTSNLPSQMNGGKDFCEWSKKDKELAKTIGKPVGMVLGRYGKGLVNLALAECAMERGEDSYDVESLAVQGRMEAEGGGRIEQYFVGTAILTWLAVFTNHPANAAVILEGFYVKAEKEDAALGLLQNAQTLGCRLALYQGRTAQIAEWMEQAPDENTEFCTMERFRYLTKVRIYIGNRKYEEALILLKKIMYYAKKMKRTYIEMEVKLLAAIMYHNMGQDKWKELLQEAISQAEEYKFVRLLSREGAALLPLLKKGDFVWRDRNFKKMVEKETMYMAEIYPSYLNKTTENTNLILSENALKILRLQAVGRNTAEIAQELAISVQTVKYHNKENYKKLGVKSKAQAINEARNRKLI